MGHRGQSMLNWFIEKSHSMLDSLRRANMAHTFLKDDLNDLLNLSREAFFKNMDC